MSEVDPQGTPSPVNPAETKSVSYGPKKGHCCCAGGSFVASIAGLAVVVLAIIVLAGTQSPYLLPVIVIVVAAAFLVEGCALCCRCNRLVECDENACTPPPPVGGVNCHILAGLAGVILGVLALLGIVPATLIAVSIIIFGSAVILGSCLKAKLCCMECCPCPKCAGVRHVAHESATAAAGSQVLVGLAVTILGIVALLGHNPLVLSQVALLVLGSAFLLCGTAHGGRTLMSGGHGHS